jgi:E3 ubiquitin-protein ligase HERC3
MSNNGPPVCAAFASGRAKCWGQNDYGQLGTGDTAANGPTVPFIDLGSKNGVLVNVVALSNSTVYSPCAIFDDGGLKCWGLNDHGQLGLGDTNNRGDGPGEMGDSLPFVDLGTIERAGVVGFGQR